MGSPDPVLTEKRLVEEARTVRWVLVYRNNNTHRQPVKLKSVAFPQLANVGGAIRIEQDGALSTIALSALTTVGQFEGFSIAFERLLSGTSITLPKLATTQASSASMTSAPRCLRRAPSRSTSER